MKLFSTGEVANLLGVHRDKIHTVFDQGAPKPEGRSGGRIIFTETDVCDFCDWMEEKGIAITRPDFAPKSALVVA